MAQGPRQAESGRVRCAGCRQEGRAEDLERLVFHDRVGLMFDMRGGAPGESVWVHPLPGCIRPACWSGFARVLGSTVDSLDAADWVETLRDGIQRRLTEHLTDAVRLGEVAVGRSEVVDRVRAEAVELVVATTEAGIEEISDAGVDLLADVSAGVFEQAFGGDVEIAGLLSGERAQQIGRDIEKLICLAEDDGGGKRG